MPRDALCGEKPPRPQGERQPDRNSRAFPTTQKTCAEQPLIPITLRPPVPVANPDASSPLPHAGPGSSQPWHCCLAMRCSQPPRWMRCLAGWPPPLEIIPDCFFVRPTSRRFRRERKRQKDKPSSRGSERASGATARHRCPLLPPRHRRIGPDRISATRSRARSSDPVELIGVRRQGDVLPQLVRQRAGGR